MSLVNNLQQGETPQPSPLFKLPLSTMVEFQAVEDLLRSSSGQRQLMVIIESYLSFSHALGSFCHRNTCKKKQILCVIVNHW